MILRPEGAVEDVPESESPLYLPVLDEAGFQRLLGAVLENPNLGAGIDCTGTSGTGKTNFSQWAIQECLRRGIPFILLDPHGDSAQKTWRLVQEMPPRIRESVLFWQVADPNHVVGINPLAHSADEDSQSEHHRACCGRVQVELTADTILAAAGEGSLGFTSRPVMRKWMIRWLWLLWNAGLTLADASFLLDPQHPIYELLLKLAPDSMSRYQLTALSRMKPFDVEGEIGSARNRISPLLEHPVSQLLFSRRQNNLDFANLYRSRQSLIVDLSREFNGEEVLTQEVQRLVANILLTQYLAVVMSTPLAERHRRMCVIDELPVFSESCAPLLERICTEVRKYQNSFLFLHQGGARFPDRTENEFLQTIIDMCRVKLFYRHNVDAEFFGRQVALAAYGRPRRKHVQTGLQQLTIGSKIVSLMDVSEGNAELDGDTISESETDQLADTLTNATEQASKSSQTRTKGKAKTKARQRTQTMTTSRTFKQTIQPIIDTREVVNSIQFYSTEETIWAGASAIKQLDTGQAVLMVDGIGVWLADTPEVRDPGELAPKFHQRRAAALYQKMVSRPEFSTPDQVKAERAAFLAQFTTELRRLQSDGEEAGSRGSLAAFEQPLLKDETTDPEFTL